MGAPARFSLFAWQKAVRDDASLTSTQKLVALVLSTYMTAKTGADAHPGGALLRDGTGLHVRTVYAALDDLVECGWLRLVRKGQAPRRGQKRVASEYAASTALGVLDDWSSEATDHPESDDRESWLQGPGVLDDPISSIPEHVPRAKRHRLDPATEHGRTVGSTLGLDEPAGRQELRDRWSSNSEALGRAFGAFERARAAREATA